MDNEVESGGGVELRFEVVILASRKGKSIKGKLYFLDKAVILNFCPSLHSRLLQK